ncbi:MAG: TauD/TfdA family dioxygenase [Gammaproteobacteria bacterium]|nr:TauD/TfdA family dioxygenase [Gammaproteobacteria bacterium]
MHIHPSNATLGATVTDVDLAGIDDVDFMNIESAWHRFAVLVFPGQHLSDKNHLAFTRRFGRLERGLKRRRTGAGLGRLSNVDRDGHVVPGEQLQARFQRGNRDWHSDSSYKRVGAKASILAAHVVPNEGGETEWADMRAAYDALDAPTKERLEGKTAVHSYRFSHAWHGGLELLSAQELDGLPPVEHPLVRIHPATGRRNLFVGRHASHIRGEDLESSRLRLRELTAWACRPPRVWRHRWKPGDIAIWDNRCVLHRGRPWPEDQPRVMARSTVAGEDPDNEWALAEGTG